MTDYLSGTVLGARLEDLVRVANGHLQLVEDAYQRIYDKLADVQYRVSTTFVRHADFGGGGGDKHAADAQDFAETLGAYIRESQESISLTGDALRIAAQEYARTDDAASDELKRLMKTDVLEHNGKQQPIPDLPL
jgi:hypothetical protein